jgi:hypothetical protein
MDEAQKLELRKLIADAMAQQQNVGAMGFDQKLFDRAMSDPEAMEAGADMAGLMNDNTALGLMSKSGDYQVPNGGSLGWTEALSKGIDKGLGTYNLLNAQKVKANALRAMGGGNQAGATPLPNPEIDSLYGQ